MTTIDEVRNYNDLRGQCTSLITLYVPQDADLNTFSKLLINEISAAGNVKDKSNRMRIIMGLKSCV
jgi:peptide subunit release factor 1 (eRF1)